MAEIQGHPGNEADRTSFITPLLGGLCGRASIKAVIETHQVARGPGRIASPKKQLELSNLLCK